MIPVILFWSATIICGFFILWAISDLIQWAESEDFLVILAIACLWVVIGLLPSLGLSVDSTNKIISSKDYEVLKPKTSRIIVIDKNALTGLEANSILSFEKLSEINQIDSLNFDVIKETRFNMWNEVIVEEYKIKFK